MSKLIKNQPSNFTNDDVHISETKNVYSGFFQMQEVHLRHKLFAGGWSKMIRREMFERGHAVAVLPYDPILGKFILIEQFRLGAMASSDTPWLIEIIAGMIEPQESPEEVCLREAQEEAGIELTHLTKVLSYLSSPGGTTERLHIYLAAVDSSTAHGIHGLEYESEDIRVLAISEEQAIQWLSQGKIDNAAAIIALQWFMLNKQSLLKEWTVVSG